MDPVNMSAKFEVRSFTRSWDNRGTLKHWAVPGYAHAPFSPKCFVRMDYMNVPAKFEVRSFTRSWDNMGYLKTLGSLSIRRSRTSKVIDFGTNRNRVCDFLLVHHSNFGHILHRFGDIAGFCAPEWPHPHSTLILEVLPLHQIARVGVSPIRSLKLFGR